MSRTGYILLNPGPKNDILNVLYLQDLSYTVIIELIFHKYMLTS